jgi:hypothetical protein
LSKENIIVVQTRMVSRQRDTGRPTGVLGVKIRHGGSRASGSVDGNRSGLAGLEPHFYFLAV